MSATDTNDDPLLHPHEVAAMFCVSPRTVALWERQGKIHAVRTAGGHRRYRLSTVHELLAKGEKADES